MTLNDKSGVRVAVDDYSQEQPVAMAGVSWARLTAWAAVSLFMILGICWGLG
jgi:hypothetical protein